MSGHPFIEPDDLSRAGRDLAMEWMTLIGDAAVALGLDVPEPEMERISALVHAAAERKATGRPVRLAWWGR